MDLSRLMLLPEPRQQIELEVDAWGIVRGHVLMVRGGDLTLQIAHDPYDLRDTRGALAAVLYGRAGGQYRLRGTIRLISGNDVTLKCEGEPERHQRRNYVRMPIHIPVRVQRITGVFDKARETRDLSGGGLRLSGGAGMHVDDILGLEIDLPDGRPPVPAWRAS